ncbi:cold shock domain-containing protein [Magnetovirga frankeli]|uniref:cold shock domain-containing protein n=1 Tax=Magnetovirga frankeli TaxID=947516 RepID=UPI00129342CF|nr:cold shock domain-containing protein [gamma proteobacterium SS-5]
MTSNLQKGKIKQWNDEKGFGFISPEGGEKDVFIHISALKQAGRRPIVGDVIFYQIQTDNDGRIRAVNAGIEGVKNLQYKESDRKIDHRKRIGKSRNSSWISKGLAFSLIVLFVMFLFGNFFTQSRTPNNSTPFTDHKTEEKISENFSCNGKVYCSEMSSCEEAQFYLLNCPGTKMDGDGDGIPCESQWCDR